MAMPTQKEFDRMAIDNCRVEENTVRFALRNGGDLLWVQLGGPVKATRIKRRAELERVQRQINYERTYGEWYEPQAFNESLL